MKHTYYVTCPYCGSNLDPGERCDCEESEVKENDTSGKSERDTTEA